MQKIITISLILLGSPLFAASVNLNVTGGLSSSDDITVDDAIFTDTATFRSGVHMATTVSGSKVGIGTTSPAWDLQVGDTTGDTVVGIDGGTGSNTILYFLDAGTAQNQLVQNNGTQILSFFGGAGWRFNENSVNGDFVIESDNLDPAFHLEGSNGFLGLNTGSPTQMLDVTGNIAISGDARRIMGDMTNGTHANRLLFITTTTNNTTNLGIIPNGTATTAQLNLYNSSDPDNASVLRLAQTATGSRVISASIGSGVPTPLVLQVPGGDAVTVTTANAFVGIGTSNPVTKVNISSGIVKTDGTTAYHTFAMNTTTPTAVTTEASIWAVSESGNAEMKVIDGAGNVTKISPHDPVSGDWVFYSENVKTGRRVFVNMEKFIRRMEEITGEKFIFNEPQ